MLYARATTTRSLDYSALVKNYYVSTVPGTSTLQPVSQNQNVLRPPPKIAPYSVRQLVPLYMTRYQSISALILLYATVSVAYFWLRESLIEY